jgi:2-C-methyl-D-erythritol 4-phosphate cytidylyltransferase
MDYAGILAAGIGVRMHRQDIPKQFLPLGAKPIIVHTVEQFLINPGIGRIVIVAPMEWARYTEDLLARHQLTGKDLTIIPGGANKTESIGRIVRHIDSTYEIREGDVLLAHDAIRPFITQRLIDEHIAAAKKYGGANTAMVTNDAILVSHDGNTVAEVPPHERLYAEQTPQSYLLAKLRDVLDEADAGGVPLSQESELPRLWLKAGCKMRLIRGEYFNMKIINPYDLEVANALIKEREG